MMPFERLDAWRASHELAVAIYAATKAFPKSELYGLTSQLRRAAFSVPANIAEGSAKRGSVECRRFLDVAVGSFSEVTYGLLFGRDVGLLSVEAFQKLETLRSRTGKLLWGLYESIPKKSRELTRHPPSVLPSFRRLS